MEKMAYLEKSKLFGSSKLDSRVKSANTTAAERWLGFFASPAIIFMAYITMSGTYLNQFYIDVLKLGSVAGGLFMALLPVLSKVVDAVTNLLMGVVIDRTKTRQGKARPWMFIAAPILTIAGILLYVVPNASTAVQAIWVGISYNLYFAFAFTIYNMSQTLMVPLSTRNATQRDKLALFTSMAQNMIPGMVIYIIVPMFLLPFMGVDPARWATVMSIISIVVLPGTLLQYYFTKERVSEDAAASEAQAISLSVQIKTCFKDKYWLMYFGVLLMYQFSQNLYNACSVFFANWVLGTYNDGTTLTLMNAIGQAPLGLGVFLLWPIAKRFGKRKTFFVGMLMATVGSFTISFAPGNMGAVLGALSIKAFGSLPTYLFVAMMAEAMDHIEWKNGFRCDGFTATVSSVLVTVMGGVGTSLFNSGLSAFGYVPPAADGSWVVQNAATQNWIVLCFAVIPAVTYLISAIIIFFYRIEDDVPQMSADIYARHRAEAEARGEVYYSPEEKAEMERQENERKAEEIRIKELKEKCAKKGLNFEQEEAKYQAKLAAKNAKKK